VQHGPISAKCAAEKAACKLQIAFGDLQDAVRDGSKTSRILWKSGYIPKWLAGFGVVASALLAVGTFAAIPFPAVRSIITSDVYGDPIGIFELIAGLWLLFVGLRTPNRQSTAAPHSTGNAQVD